MKIRNILRAVSLYLFLSCALLSSEPYPSAIGALEDLELDNSPPIPTAEVLDAGMSDAEIRLLKETKLADQRLQLHSTNQNRNVLENVPPAMWHGGCAPTAVAMILMYYEKLGYDIFPNNVGTNFDTPENIELIASARHFDDFYYPDDRENTETRNLNWKNTKGTFANYRIVKTIADRSEDAHYMDYDYRRFWYFHRPDCVADFLHTSFSIENSPAGSTDPAAPVNRLPFWINQHVPGVTLDAKLWWVRTEFLKNNPDPNVDPWEIFKTEIDAGRPVKMSVDSDGDGASDHAVAAIGWEEIDGVRYYACLNTWVSEIKWYQWAAIDLVNQPFSIRSMNVLNFHKEPVSEEIFSPLYLYRFYRPSSGAYFFSANPIEVATVENLLDHEWKFQGPVFRVEIQPTTMNKPVYRFYNAKAAAHFYTISEVERDNVIQTRGDIFTYEGIAFYAHPDYQPGDNYVYRFYLPQTGSHFFTNSYEEAAYLYYYKDKECIEYEGVAWYARDVPKN